MPQMMHHKAENSKRILYAIPNTCTQYILCSVKLSSSTNIIKTLLHNFCRQNPCYCFWKMTVGKHWTFLCKFWHEEAMICCKTEGCLILYLINTQCRAFLGPMISCGGGTRLHTWRNASLSSRRKLDKRAILPLNQRCCQPH